MANAPDTLIVTGPTFQQISADAILVTPTSGTQTTLAAALGQTNDTFVNPTLSGGTIASATTLSAAGEFLVTSGGSEVIGASGVLTVSSAGSATFAAGAVITNAATITNSAGVFNNSGGTILNTSGVINGGTVIGASIENGSSFVLFSVGSITPAGTAQTNGTPVTAMTTTLLAAASTTGIVLPSAATALGIPLNILNIGTAAIHIYGNGSGSGADTIDGTAGTTGVTLTNAHRCIFTATAAGAFVSGPEGGVTS